MVASNLTSLTTPISNGILDQLGTGQVVNGQIQFVPIPSTLASMPSDNWFMAQWGQPQPIDFSGYNTNNPATYDPLYGNSLYSFINPAITSALEVYQNTPALGDGVVVQMTNGNTLLPASSGQTAEADEFLSTKNGLNGNLGQVTNLTINLKVLQSLIQFTDPAAKGAFYQAPNIFSLIDIGFTMNFYGNAQNGLPNYSGFVQIVPWSSNEGSTSYHNGVEPSNTNSSFQFITSLLLPGDNQLSLLPSDKSAAPTTLSFSINKYVADTFSYAFSGLTPAQQAIVENQANWTLGGMYVGIATNDAQFIDATKNYSTQEAANISSTVQISNIQLTSDPNQTYSSTSSVALPQSVDTNPLINYSDNSLIIFTPTPGSNFGTNGPAAGTADGGLYTGTLAGIQDEYIYTSNDDVNLTITNGLGWLINLGGGNSATIQATSGSFDLEITPSTLGPRNISLGSSTQEIIFDSYSSVPTISSQASIGGELTVTFSDQTTLSLADPTNDQVNIIGNQVQFHPLISYYDEATNQQISTFGTDYIGTLSGITDEFNFSGTDNINLTISNGNNWLIDVGSYSPTIAVASGSVSILIEPDNTAQRIIVLDSNPMSINFSSFTSQPIIISQSLRNGIQNILLSDNTNLILPISPTAINNMATIVGNQLIEAVPCFLIYTDILTPTGNIAVQNLKIGDEIVTANGNTKLVKWIGRRSYNKKYSENQNFWPIQIKAGALEKDVPANDLFLSPQHGILITDVLIPAAALVNGVSIVRRTDFDRVDYFHIEMEDHDIILANGTPVESFIDMQSRCLFENAADYESLYPLYTPPKPATYGRVEFGNRLETIRKKLAVRCDLKMKAKKGRAITAFIEAITDNEIIGWASAPDDQLIRCEVKVIDINNTVLVTSVANEFRRDVQCAGFGDGRYGFRMKIPFGNQIKSVVFT